MADPRLAKLADLLVNYSARVRKGDLVKITGSALCEPLLAEVYRSVLRAGGHPYITLLSDQAAEDFVRLAGNDQLYAMHQPFPLSFTLFTPEFSWHLVAGLEIIGAIALTLGLGARLFSILLSLLMLTAIATAYAGPGYTIMQGGWMLSKIYLAMLLPLILSGPGKLSIDHLLRERFLRAQRRLWS